MKRNIYLYILSSFFIFPLFSYTTKQIESININYTIEKESEKSNTKYSLKISIDNNNPVDVYLYRSEPNPKNLIFDSKKNNQKEFKIEKLKTGTYTLIVYENEYKAVIEKFNIGN